MQAAYYGDTVRINCKTEYNVTWLKDGGAMPKKVWYRKRANLVKMTNVTHENNGFYTCFYKDRERHIHFGTSQLLVGGKLI